MSLINIEKTIELDVYDHDTTPSVIKTIQMDAGTRIISAMIQNSRQTYDIGQNAAVSLTVLRPDNTRVQIVGQTFGYNGADGTMYGAKAELSDVALAVNGNLKAQFKFISGEQELRTEIFAINNGEALDAGDGDWAGDLDGHNLDEMAESIETLQTNMATVNEDVSELKSGLNELDGQINGTQVLTPTQIPLSNFTVDNWKLWKSDGKWGAQNNAGYYIALPSDTVKVTINGNADRELLYAFLSSYQPVSGQVAPIVGSTAIPTPVSAGGASEVDVPQGSAYLWIQRINADGLRTDPSSVTFYNFVPVGDSLVSRIEALKNDSPEVEQLQAEVDALSEDVGGMKSALPSNIVYERKTINASGEITASTESLLSGKAEAESGQTITINNSAFKFRVVWYRDDGTFGGILDWITDTFTIASNYIYQIHIRRASGSGTVTIADSEGLITTNVPFPTEFVDLSPLLDLPTAESIEALQTKTDEIGEQMPFVYQLTREWINTSGVITASNLSLLSGVILATSGMTMTIVEPYDFRIVVLGDDETTVRGITNWSRTYTIASSAPIRVHIRNGNYPNDYIYPEDVSDGQITTTIPIPKTYIPVAPKESLENYLKFEQYNLNVPFVGKEDMMWTWWSYPQIMSFKRVRNKLYWTYTTHDGYSGVASYDFDTHDVVKNHLKKSDSPDDHNNMTVYVLNDGTVLTAYTESHYSNHKMYIRRSTVPESVESFGDAVEIDTTNYVTYARIFEYNGTLWLFTRSYVKNWNYMTSADGGVTWSAETEMITANMQYYVLVTPTTTDGVLRLVMYSNPNETDPNIRLGFLHLDDGGIYNSDNTTLLGTSSVPATSFDIIVPVESGKTQRLLDCAVTDPSITKVLYCPFTEQSDDTAEEDYVYDAVYKLYNNGTIMTVCDAGYTTWKQRYQNGASFIDVDNIVVGRSDGTYDYIEKYSISGNIVTLAEEIKKEALGNVPIRNARPIVDINGKALMWWRGFYNHNSYHDFNTDAMMHLLP